MARPQPPRSDGLRPAVTRCAIYTRKSTEEGLEQEFNSLDAQREACAAYILSQRHEGWTQTPSIYDDGGYSGGTMDRPGLKQLLAEVHAGRVDVIVVYKVDRLTRSLADFAKIVEVLDGAGASFVSVTQAFNTTTSMGRLTLNVLLSFAQFEREVTGERIRDKVAASKKKGMWMGGVVPLGYEVNDRKLVVVEGEAKAVRHIFQRYLDLGSIVLLADELARDDVRTRQRLSRNGRIYGGVPFGAGALAYLLQNRMYLGKIHHHGTWYEGEQQAILDPDLFERAQQQLDRNRVDRKLGTNANEVSLLAGLVWDAHGRRMKPSHAAKGARRYRYYISRTDGPQRNVPVWRVPAGDLEEVVVGRLRQALTDPNIAHDLLDVGAGDIISVQHVQRQLTAVAARLHVGAPTENRAILLSLVRRIEIREDDIALQLDIGSVAGLPIKDADGNTDRQAHLMTCVVPARVVRAGKGVRLAISPSHRGDERRLDGALIKLAAKAHAARKALGNDPERGLDAIAAEYGLTKDYFRVLIKVSFLAPDITAAILEGRQPATLTRQMLVRFPDLPMDWDAQREVLGFV